MQPAGTGADLSRVQRLDPLILCRGGQPLRVPLGCGATPAEVRVGEGQGRAAVRRGVREVVGNLLWSVRQEGLREGRRVRLRAGGCAPGAGGAMERSPPVRFAGSVRAQECAGAPQGGGAGRAARCVEGGRVG